MKAALQRYARRLWAGRGGPVAGIVRLLLLPAEWAWRGVTVIRNLRYDRTGGEAVPGLSVISVGNLAVGGTGKTPVASWVVRQLVAFGRRPVVLHGGYGRDEPLLHARWTPDVPVVTGRDRVTGGHRAADLGADVAVLDDGFQHRRIARDLDLVLVAVEDPFPGPCLPRGPYREGPRALLRADGVILTRKTASEEDARALAGRIAALLPGVRLLGALRLTIDGLIPLDGGVGRPAPGAQALVVTAVGRPSSVERSVAEALGADVDLVSYADHHDFTRQEAVAARARAGTRPIVVTEKDAVKLEAFAEALGECYVARQTIEWDWGEDDVRGAVQAALQGPARTNRSAP